MPESWAALSRQVLVPVLHSNTQGSSMRSSNATLLPTNKWQNYRPFNTSHSLFMKLFLQCSDTGWLGDRKGIQPVKSWVLVCWWWRYDWSIACVTAPVVTTTSITFSSNKIQNGDILVLTNTGPAGKWSLKRTQRERQTDSLVMKARMCPCIKRDFSGAEERNFDWMSFLTLSTDSSVLVGIKPRFAGESPAFTHWSTIAPLQMHEIEHTFHNFEKLHQPSH